MATILEFRGTQRGLQSIAGGGAAASAEIVLFPGVRYERWTGDESDAPGAAQAYRRDKLTLDQ